MKIMGCSSCETKNGLPKGCKNNGACGDNGCNKLPVFDWLSNMKQPVDFLEFNFVEVRFKNERKEFFQNTDKIPLHVGDVVAVESSSGHDIGVVTMCGELVRVQMQRKKVRNTDELPKIYRKANEKVVETWVSARIKEEQTK